MTTEPTRTVPASPTEGSDAVLEAHLQRLIGRQLRATYDDVVKEPLPEHLVRLLDDLAAERGDA
jgi:hypothetical protein